MKDEKYLELLAEKYPTEQAVCREIINLKAILGLPKGTEHFMSDLHGEYEAFCHILNNCSGVIREKVDLLFEETLSDIDREEICTLIYYPVEKLEMMKKESRNNEEWYRVILGELIEIARLLSSKYTRSKVRKAMPDEYAYILDELIHVQKDEDDNQVAYHQNIIDTLLELDSADAFIEVLAALIKRLAVDHLHIVGDIFDRGPCADRIDRGQVVVGGVHAADLLVLLDGIAGAPRDEGKRLAAAGVDVGMQDGDIPAAVVVAPEVRPPQDAARVGVMAGHDHAVIVGLQEAAVDPHAV